MSLTYQDRFNDLDLMDTYFNHSTDSQIYTGNVMREETELLLKRQKTIFNILTVVTIVTILITVKYSQN